MEIRTLTFEEQEKYRQERLAEVGTEPECPFCHKPRVKRSDYIRCNPCGTNWLDGEDIFRNPKSERWEKFMASTRPIKQGTNSTAPSAKSTSEPMGGQQQGKAE